MSVVSCRLPVLLSSPLLSTPARPRSRSQSAAKVPVADRGRAATVGVMRQLLDSLQRLHKVLPATKSRGCFLIRLAPSAQRSASRSL